MCAIMQPTSNQCLKITKHLNLHNLIFTLSRKRLPSVHNSIIPTTVPYLRQYHTHPILCSWLAQPVVKLVVTDCGVRGLWFKSPGSILTSRTETSYLSRVVRRGWDPWSVPVSGLKNSLLRWSLRFGRWTATTVQKTTQKQKTNKTTVSYLQLATQAFARRDRTVSYLRQYPTYILPRKRLNAVT